MKNSLILMVILVFIGCATDNFSHVPEEQRIPTKWDGRWEWSGEDKPKSIYLWFDIKYGFISGRMGHTSWRGDAYLQISGQVIGDNFTFGKVYHADLEHVFDITVNQAAGDIINGYLVREDQKQFWWMVKRKK